MSTSSVGERSAAADSWMASLFIGSVCPGPGRPHSRGTAILAPTSPDRGVRHNARVYLTITSTGIPATDLGYLLHKHPGRAQSIDLPVGRAHVFYPEATPEQCTAALLLEVDPIGLVRGKRST